MMGDKLKTVITIIIGLATLVTLTLGAHAYFAKQVDFEQLAMRLDQKIAYDKYFELQKRLWYLQDKYNVKDCLQMPQPDRDTCRAIQKEMAEIDSKFKTTK